MPAQSWASEEESTPTACGSVGGEGPGGHDQEGGWELVLQLARGLKTGPLLSDSSLPQALAL